MRGFSASVRAILLASQDQVKKRDAVSFQPIVKFHTRRSRYERFGMENISIPCVNFLRATNSRCSLRCLTSPSCRNRGQSSVLVDHDGRGVAGPDGALLHGNAPFCRSPRRGGLLVCVTAPSIRLQPTVKQLRGSFDYRFSGCGTHRLQSVIRSAIGFTLRCFRILLLKRSSFQI